MFYLVVRVSIDKNASSYIATVNGEDLEKERYEIHWLFIDVCFSRSLRTISSRQYAP